jgi:choline-sulfatase
LYDHAQIEMPAVPNIPFEQRDPWSQRYYQLIRQDEHVVTDQMILSARHAYYGMVSYIDHKVGLLLNTLEQTGTLDNTVIVFTADHGEMLGERGMWFKFNPYEQSIKVPLIVHAPGAPAARRVGENCSLVDLLPTLLDLATDGQPPALADRIDGRSLSPLLHGADPAWADEALIEFTGEGVHAPALILRQGHYKYVYCEGDPGMMFDLKSDPSELRNLCQDPAHQALAQRFVADIEKRFEPARIKQEVLASQRRRLFLHTTLVKGKHTPWDFEVNKDASKQYVRSVGSTSTTATKAKARYPFVPSVPPDTPRPPKKS